MAGWKRGFENARYVVQVRRSDKKPEVSWDSHCLGNVVTEWLTNWPTDWLTDWLTDRVVDWEHQWRNSTTRARLRCFLHINSKSRIRLYEETVAYIRFCQNASVQFSSVQFKMVSMLSEKTICAPLRLSEVSLLLLGKHVLGKRPVVLKKKECFRKKLWLP